MELSLDLTKRYTYADYLTWLDDKRRELIDGFIHLMSPAPKDIHAKVSKNIELRIGLFLLNTENCGCELRHAPYDVRLPNETGIIDSVVQPDICIICDPSKIDEKGCLGAPDMIVEILSERTTKYDWNYKFNLYEKHGVTEYWIVNPNVKTINVFVIQENGKYDDGKEYVSGEKIPVFILNGLEIDTNLVFR
jgi:Uma2 family endonuclease